MFGLLIAIIYLAFISLGLPDSLLGSAWPVMHLDIGAGQSLAGIVSMLISLFTITSSLFSARITTRFGTGKVTCVSVFLTAIGMFAFSRAKAFWQLCVFAIPYGLGAGAIDAALNNYVALHLSSKHMSWLHCMWGIGASISPYIMAAALAGKHSWMGGYATVSAVQLVLGFVMLAAIPLWDAGAAQVAKKNEEEPVEEIPLTIWQTLKLPGAVPLFAAFFLYCAIESFFFVWASTYFVEVYQVEADKAASFASLFYLGMTASRGLSGFIADKLGDRRMVRYSISFVLFFALIALIPVKSFWLSFVCFILMGFGCGPVYPAIVHATPEHFGREYSGSVIGVQMACAYMGSMILPFVFGKIAEFTGMRLMIYLIVAFAATVLFLTEMVNRLCDKRFDRQ